MFVELDSISEIRTVFFRPPRIAVKDELAISRIKNPLVFAVVGRERHSYIQPILIREDEVVGVGLVVHGREHVYVFARDKHVHLLVHIGKHHDCQNYGAKRTHPRLNPLFATIELHPESLSKLVLAF